jgi:hypothetical protein
LLSRDGDKWDSAARPDSTVKGPHRYGPFKEAFKHRMLFVYGTAGTPEENAWALSKARYDAETFWYRGNGSVDVIADTAFHAANEQGRNVILYGNADTNRVWKLLLSRSPIQIQRGRLRMGEREMVGDDLGCLFLYPRPDHAEALVGVVAGTGPTGMRLTNRIAYFVSGVGLPDCVVFTPAVLEKGTEGVRAAGYFGPDWQVSTGEFASRE